VLDALDAAGLRGDGRLLQLNSYENRVFQVMLEDGGAVVAKFYRPGRWTDAQIAEEHAFATEAAAAELPVVAPLALDIPGGGTLAHAVVDGQTFRLAVYPRRAGHGPDLDRPDVLRWLGRFIGRLHVVGARQPFAHRRRLDSATFGHQALSRLLALDMVGPAQIDAFRSTAEQALAMVDAAFAAVPFMTIRLHGDCHPGNILWRDDGDGRGGPHIVDLDDAVTGPAVQDLWMLLSGDRAAMQEQLAHVLAGYRQFRPFDRRELALIEPLRTLRMLHHNAWLAERWTDPAFPVAFPWFGTPNHWSQQTVELREQIAAMAEPPLEPPISE
jgi:Ser/Thr protein kinase RdoA (MazF antagonist)